jgi:hypothetical protein
MEFVFFLRERIKERLICAEITNILFQCFSVLVRVKSSETP